MQSIIGLVLTGLIVVGTASCSGSSSGGKKNSRVVTNLGVSAVEIAVGERIAAILTRETDEGRDLNGDGDTADLVLQVVDMATPDVRNLALAVPAGLLRIEDEVITFGVSEAGQGQADLNGDGDADDMVVHVYRTDTGVVNTALAGRVIHGGTLVMVRVDEAAQGGMDLNRDGDGDDPVVHLVDVDSGTVLNLELALDPFGRGQVYPDRGLVSFQVSEQRQGNADRNADGDALDIVWHVRDITGGVTTNLQLAAGSETVRTGLSSNADEMGFLVGEASQGSLDLNGDGDADDFVVHALDPVLPLASSAGIAALTRDPHGHGGIMAFRVAEADEAGRDLNGDGDALDDVIHVHDFAARTTTNLGLANPTVSRSFHLQIFDGKVGFLVRESDQGGTDLNADGDALDSVPHLFDAAADRLTNLGIATDVEMDLARMHYLTSDMMLFWAQERAHGERDLNGDGDILDSVLHVHDLALAATRNLEVATTTGLPSPVDVRRGRVSILVAESEQGRDLNEDQDLADSVLHVLDSPGSRVENLEISALAAGVGASAFICIVAEDADDLNGDGDTVDGVLHVIE